MPLGALLWAPEGHSSKLKSRGFKDEDSICSTAGEMKNASSEHFIGQNTDLYLSTSLRCENSSVPHTQGHSSACPRSRRGQAICGSPTCAGDSKDSVRNTLETTHLEPGTSSFFFFPPNHNGHLTLALLRLSINRQRQQAAPWTLEQLQADEGQCPVSQNPTDAPH
ncbi:unnamed protein product [Pleuronectes platessa]|uniref:Uncharacterized protein n=1 Tax=Pleuronectes platessa TaxID=8262 RepID=A0A9N7YM54_PLEPL|nr:unnamed protein product [Pleuronectes platessa]